MDTSEPAPRPLRRVRSFVRRPGRLTAAQHRALTELLPRYAVASTGGALDLPAAFGRKAPRVLDIGFGDGEALATSAINFPGIDYLGVEIHDPGIGHLLLLVEQAALTNVRVIARDAAEIVPEIPSATLAAVNLFFPDPWPKKRHHKRRLLQPEFLGELARVLGPQGLLHVATDWADYARHTRETLAASAAFSEVEAAAIEREPLAFRAPTKFERRGRRLGHEVVDLFYRTRS